MNSVCRLCLSVNEESSHLITANDILFKLKTCLNLELTDYDAFPNNLCQECKTKIEQIHQFRVTILENQQKLQQQFEIGFLSEYYKSLTNTNEEIKTISEKENAMDESGEQAVKTCISKANNKRARIDTDNNDTNFLTTNDHDYASNDIPDTNLEANDNDNITSTIKEEKDLNETETSITITHNNMLRKEIVLKQYDCLTCDKVYDSRIKLGKHYIIDHANKITEAPKATFTERMVDGRMVCTCNVCDAVYSKSTMKRHMYFHSLDRPYVCKICGRTYTTISDIIRHGIQAHSDRKLYCSFGCGFSTSYNGALRTHEDRHREAYKYTCDECGKGFFVKTWFLQHQNIHSGLKPFICETCGAAFHMDKYLTSHRTAMHPQSLPKKRLVCIHCDLKYDSVNSLAIHMENEHGVSRNKSKSSKNKALCDFCGKILNRPEQLVLHRRMHLGEKPYNCSICNKSFPRKCSMQVHERSHSRSLRLACAHCGRHYSQQSALNRHHRAAHQGLPRERPS